MSQFTPSSLGQPIPSGTEPDFSYNLFGGLQPVEVNNQQQVLRYSLPDEFAKTDELKRKQEEISSLRLFGAVDKDDPNFKSIVQVGQYEIPTYIGMRQGTGLSTSLDAETVGEQEVNRQTTAGSGRRGIFAETNREFNRLMVKTANSEADMFPFDANESYDWATQNLAGSFGSWLKSVGDLIGWTNTEQQDNAAFNVELALSHEDRNWNGALAAEATNKFLTDKPEVAQYFELTGVDPHQFTRLSKNPLGWTFQLNQAVIQAQANLRMQIYEEETGWIGKQADKLYYGVKDPTMIRDLIVTTLASYGLATTETALAGLARTGIARSAGAAGLIDKTSLAVGRYGVRGLSGGPLTGPIENFIFQTSKVLVPTVGEKGFQTAVARSVAIMGEAAAWSGISAAQMQKEDYRFKHLVLNFGEYAPEFKYDLSSIYQAAYEGGLLGLGMFGSMRVVMGGLGDISAVRSAKPGEKISTLSRQIANSLDSFATTVEGRTVFGNRLGQNRGIAFGNWLDKNMKGLDNRNTASIVVNGKNLYHFDGFSPEVISKANFNEAKSREIVSLWAKATNTVETPESLFDPEVLSTKGLTYDQVIDTLKTFNKAIEIGVEARKSMPRGMFEAIKPYDEFNESFINKVAQDTEDQATRTIMRGIVDEWRSLNEQRTAKINAEQNKDLTELSDLEFEERRTELTTRLSELEEKKKSFGSNSSKLDKEISDIQGQLKQVNSEIAKLNSKGKYPNALKNISDALRITVKKLNDLTQKQQDDKQKRLADIDKKAEKIERKRQIYLALPDETPDQITYKNRLLNDLIGEEEKLNAKRNKIESEKGATRKEQRELVNLEKEKSELEQLESQWLLKDKQETDLQTKQKELDDLKAEYEVKDADGSTNEQRIVSTKNSIDELDRVKKETAEYDAKVKDIKQRFNASREKLNQGKDNIVFLGLTDKLKRLSDLKLQRQIIKDPKRLKRIDRIIKQLEAYFETEQGVKEAVRAKIIEDTIDNNRGFGTANTVANILLALNIQAAFGKAEKNKISIKTITSKFKEVTGKDVDYGNIKDLFNLQTVTNNLIGITHINSADSFIGKLLDLETTTTVSTNGGIVKGSAIVGLFRNILTRLDKREGKTTTTVFISDRDFTLTNQAKAGLNNIIKITIKEDGTFATEMQFGKLEMDEAGNVKSTKPELFNDPDLSDQNVIDWNTFAAMVKEWKDAADVIIKQEDEKAVKLLSTTLDEMQEDMKAILINAQLFSEEITGVFKDLLSSLEDGDVSNVILQMKKTFDDQIKEAIEATSKEQYRRVYTGIIANMFALEQIKPLLKQRVDALSNAELKAKATKELAELDNSKYTVTQAIQDYHTRPKTNKVETKSDKKKAKTQPLDLTGVTFIEETTAPVKADTETPALVPTIDNLKLVFGLTDKEARVGSIIMQALGSKVVDGLTSNVGLAKGGEENELARIFLKRVDGGVKALIKANEGADLFSISHEMGHYARFFFLDPRASVAERAAVGITDSMYDKVMSWLGVAKDADGNYEKLTDAQEEKFANGFALYLMKLLQGDGKATNTGIQFAFNKLGEHLGDLGNKFKSLKKTKDIEAAKLTPEAEEVYAALLSKTSEDNITTIFMDGFKDIISDLTEEQKTLLGQRILGSMRWEKYKAGIELEREAAAKATSAVSETIAEANTIPVERVDTVADSVETPKVDIEKATTPAAKVEAAAEAAAVDVAITRLEVKADIDKEVATSLATTVDAIITRTEPEVEPVPTLTTTPKITTERELTLNEISNLKEGDVIKYTSSKSRTDYTGVVRGTSDQLSTRWVVVKVTDTEGRSKTINKNINWWLKNKVTGIVEAETPTSVETKPTDVTAEVKPEETVTTAIVTNIRRERKPRTKKTVQETQQQNNQANTTVQEAAVKIDEVSQQEQTVAATIIEEVRAIEPTAVPVVTKQLEERVKPDLSFLGDRRSETLDKAVEDFEKLNIKLSFLSSIIGLSEAEDIVKFRALQENPIYKQKQERGELNNEFSIEGTLQYISGLLKQELSLENGTVDYLGLRINNKPLLLTSELVGVIKAAATKLGFKEETFSMMVRATFAVEKAKTDHLMSILGKKLKAIETKIAEGKKLQTADREAIAQVKTIADIEEAAKQPTIEKVSPERQELAKVIFEAYDSLFRARRLDEDSINNLYVNFVTKEGLVNLLKTRLGDDYLDPNFIRNKLKAEPARVGDPIYNLLVGSIKNLELSERRSKIGQITTKIKEVNEKGEVVEETIIQKFKKEGSQRIGKGENEVDIIGRETSRRTLQEPELEMNIEHAKAAINSGHVFGSLFKFIQAQGDTDVLNFFVAKMQAIQEGHATNYKSYIAKLFDVHNIKRNGTFAYTSETLKTLEEKAEAYIDEWLTAVSEVEPDIAKGIREVIPGVKKRKPREVTIKDEASFAQSLKQLEYFTKSTGTKLLEGFDWSKAQTTEQEILQTFKSNFPNQPTLRNLLNVIEEKIPLDSPIASSYKDIVALFKQAPKDIIDETKVEIKDARARVTLVGNIISVSEKNNINTIFHEIAHGVTVQYINRYISKASKLDSETLYKQSAKQMIDTLISIQDNKVLPKEVSNMIKAYLTYLTNRFGSLEVVKGEKKIELKNLVMMQNFEDLESIVMDKTYAFAREQEDNYKYGYPLISKDAATTQRIKTAWTKFKNKMSTVENGVYSISLAPKIIQTISRLDYTFIDDSFASSKKNIELENIFLIRDIITSIENKRGFIEGKDYFILEEGWGEKRRVYIIYTKPLVENLKQKGLVEPEFENNSANNYRLTDLDYDNDLLLANKDLLLPKLIGFKKSLPDVFKTNGLPYAAGSIYEFISEIFTREQHARFLDNIKLNNENSLKSVLVDAIRALWGIEGNANKQTLLTKVLSNVEIISKNERNFIAVKSITDQSKVLSFAQSKKIKTKESRGIKKAEKFRQDLNTSKGRWLVLATKLKQLINQDIPNETEIAKVKEELNSVLATISVKRKGLKALGLSENFSDKDIAIVNRLLEGLDPVDDLSTRLGVENANRIITADILELKDPEQKMEFVKAFRGMIKSKPQLRSFLRELEKVKTDPSFISKVADELAITREDDEAVDTKGLRDMSTEQRRDFLINEFIPKISETLGERAGPQNILSKFFEAVPGGSAIARQFQRRVGGSVSYADTVNSPYLTLAFLAKILDPNIDVRNGELSGNFRLFSMEEAEAEAKLILTSSGIPDILSEIQAKKLNEEQLKALNNIAWRYLTKPEELPTDTPNKELILGLIKARNKFNALVSDYLKQYGGLGAKLEDPDMYGTSHRPSLYAINNPDEFVKALTKHETEKFLNSNELNGATLHAMGWIEITRANDDGHVDMVVIREDSPIAGLFEDKQITKKDAKKTKKITWGKAKKQLQIKDEEGNLRLPQETLDRYYDALKDVTDDYLPAWTEYYKNFANPTAIFVSMRTAKDRILRVPEGESDNKSLSPKTYYANKASDYTEERLFTHDELVGNEELAKFFNDNILGLTIEEANVRLFQHVVTKKLTEVFGVRMSFDDLLQFAKLAELNYVRDIDKVSVKERESFFRGWEKIRRSWLQKTNRLSTESSDYDPSFKWLMESSPGIIMALGGLSAGTKTVVSELPRALLASDRNRSFVTQFIPNLFTMLKYTFGLNAAQKRLELLKQASAIHWTRAVLEDTFSANYEHSASRHDYAGPVLGRQGWWRNLSGRWNSLVEANRMEKTASDKASNIVASIGWLGGSLLRWSNEMVNVISMQNAMHNIQSNITNFRNLAIMLDKYGTELSGKSPRRAEFNKLARSCGISPEEALDLSRSGLLDLETINIMHKALTKDYKLVTTEGLPDSSKLLKWAETLSAEDQVKAKNAVYKLAGYIKTLARNTNTEPTLLDTRVTVDPVARALRLYTQFGTSNSVQAIGRVRRSGNAALARFVAGQFLMQVAGGVLISYLLNAGDEDEATNEITSSPVAFMLTNAARMPVYGNYSWLFKLLVTGAYQTYAHVAQEDVPKSMERLDLPNVIDSPFQYRFDAMTKDFEKMPGIITRYMEGKPLTRKQREQAIQAIPFLDNMLLSGLIKNALEEEYTPPTVGRVYNPGIIESKKPAPKAVESPMEPRVQQPMVEPTPEVGMPREPMPVARTTQPLNIPSRPVKLQGVSTELADLLERF